MIRSSMRSLKAVSCLSEHSLGHGLGNQVRILGFRPKFWMTTATVNSTENSTTTQNDTRSSAANANESSKNEVKGSESDARLAEKDKLLEEKEKLLKELQDKYKRSLAENQNVLQRGRKQVEEARLFGIQSFSKDLLEVADILEKATTTVPKEELDKNIHLKNLFEGLTMTELQLQKVFMKNGLEKVNPKGEKFNPHFHEAVFHFDVPDKDDGMVAVVQKIGYKLSGRTLRPALVGVVKRKVPDNL